MKWNVVQDFANVCAQMLLTSLSNSDRINFAILGSGTIGMDRAYTVKTDTHYM